MYFSKATIFKVALPLVFALSLFSGVEGATTDPTPPAAGTAVQLQTYGMLPVIVLNLTQTPINYLLSTTTPAAYTSAGAPIAVGLHGWTYINNQGNIGVTSNPTNSNGTSYFPNPTTPTIPPGNYGSNPSLSPSVSAPTGSTVFAANPQWSFMNTFALFPSWSGAVNFPNTSFYQFDVAPPGTMAATPGTNDTGFNVSAATTAYGQSMAAATDCSLIMDLMNTSGSGFPATITYVIDIKSLGGKTSSFQPTQSTSAPVNWYDAVLKAIGDVDAIIGLDPVAAATSLLGIVDTIKGISDDISSTSANTTNLPYPATYQGIGVTASVMMSKTPANLTAVDGNNDFLMYKTQPVALSATPTTTLPLELQNGVFVTTYRQHSPSNTSTSTRNSADTLIVAIINEALYSSTSVQQYLNTSASSQSVTATAQYKPTKEQAEDSLKILGILTAISHKNPQDAQKIIELFGFVGQYQKAKNDPAAMTKIKTELKEVLEKHEKDIPAISQYLTKLEQKH